MLAGYYIIQYSLHISLMNICWYIYIYIWLYCIGCIRGLHTNYIALAIGSIVPYLLARVPGSTDPGPGPHWPRSRAREPIYWQILILISMNICKYDRAWGQIMYLQRQGLIAKTIRIFSFGKETKWQPTIVLIWIDVSEIVDIRLSVKSV